MVFDSLLKPIHYYLEKQVASRSIPDVSHKMGRKRLANQTEDSGETFDHSTWNALLLQFVSIQDSVGNTKQTHVVDYASLSKDPRFDAYIGLLAKAEPGKLSQREQLAFWMNAYNALCINHIIKYERDHEAALSSINNLTSLQGPTVVWDQVAGQVGGKDYSLNQIEHEELRGSWDEPRLHACIVCASASCPNLRQEAFVGTRIEEQMNDQVNNWLSNTTKGMLVEGNKLTVSRIFLWFQADFGGNWSGLKDFLSKHCPNKAVCEKLSKGHLTLRYFEYDWSINRAVNQELSL